MGKLDGSVSNSTEIRSLLTEEVVFLVEQILGAAQVSICVVRERSNHRCSIVDAEAARGSNCIAISPNA
jgi:hypothetical protein